MRTGFCPSCGSMIFPSMDRCSACGRPMDGSVTDWKPIQKSAGPAIIEEENRDAPYLPYKPRETQIDIIADIRSALNRGKHIVIESGTGTGKTITSLAGSLEHAEAHGKKIIYITRTISQSDQVMKELKAISTLKPVSGITLTGRNKSCPLLQARADFDKLSPTALSTLCSDRKQKSQQGRPGGCPYFEKVPHLIEIIEDYCKKQFPRSDEIDAYCKARSVCPYEIKKAMMKDFDVIVAPYIHIIDPDIRENFFSALDVEEKDVVLIVDEAHNLMDAVRSQESFTISTRLINSAADECQAFNKPEVADRVTLDDFMKAFKSAVRELGSKKIGFNMKEALLEPNALEDILIRLLGLSLEMLNAVAERLVELGEKREEAIADTDAPSSPMLEFATLVRAWIKSPADRYVKSIKVNEEGEFPRASCIDPVVICGFMNALPGAVHMSGTLQPLDNYAKVLGLPNTAIPRTYPSPFPKDNKLVVYTKDMTMNYQELQANPSMKTKIQKMIAQLCNAVDKNILVFMPSYRVMKEFRPYLEQNVFKNLYWEVAGRQKETMKNLDDFRRGRSGVFVCVMGGS
ncbi:MAG: DEAD/DEAH box helicase family protein, partial [archaeon]|nr:DEAD/DEAH box helicase family protein [archaeon]